MARARTKAVELARLLNAASQPIYVLDDEHSIVFSNRALLEWVGRAAEEMEGLRCAYHSSSDVGPLEALAAGLCPPPAAMASEQLEGTVEAPLPDGRSSRRRARFVPLSPGDTVTLIVLVDPDDLVEGHQQPEPVEPETVRLHERLRRFRRQAAVRFGAERLVGDSPAVRRARAQIELAAGSRVGVLVVGPPGSGRQHVAAAIHYGGDRKSAGSMIPLACGVLGTELIQSTIHALASGKWSGEDSAPATLVLNEADRLPPEIQPELVAVLTRKSFPLRAIATAEAPLGELVRRGEFREDLAAALSTVTIELPPLARRREDLPVLAQLFVEESNARGGKQLAGFSPEALDRLDGYDWPGNVDELAGMVAEAHARAAGPEITPADLPERIRLAAAARAHPPRVEETIVLDEFLGRIERELIRRALASAKGNKARAARLLGMTRPRLYRRLVQLGFEEEGS